MPAASDCKGTLGLSEQDFNDRGHFLCISGLNEAFRGELGCQGPIRLNALGVEGVIGHVDSLEASVDEGLTLLCTLSQQSRGQKACLGLNRWILTQFTGCKMLDSAVRSAETPRERLKTNDVFILGVQLEAYDK